MVWLSRDDLNKQIKTIKKRMALLMKYYRCKVPFPQGSKVKLRTVDTEALAHKPYRETTTEELSWNGLLEG